MDRREFCLAGAVMATSFAVAGDLPASPLILDAVFDSRFPAACNVGATACRDVDALAAYLARNTPSK